MPLDTPSQIYGTLLYHRCNPLIALAHRSPGFDASHRNRDASIKPPIEASGPITRGIASRRGTRSTLDDLKDFDRSPHYETMVIDERNQVDCSDPQLRFSA